MQKDNRAKPNSDRRIHPTNDDQTHRDTESPSPTPHIQPLSASPIPDAAQRGAGPRRHSINSVGSAHSDSSKDDTRSPGIPPFAIGKRKASISSIGSDDQSDSERRSSHFSQKSRSRTSIASLKPLSVTKKQTLALSANFKVPAILLLSNKLFNGIYVTSKMMFIMSVLSVFMCVIENEIWFSVYMAEENALIEEASAIVLSESQVFRSNICKLVLSCCTALLCYYITVYYKQLLELKRLRQSEVDTFLNDQSTFRRSGLMGWYFLEMLVCLVHIPYGMDFDIIIEFRSIKAFYRGEMIVTLFIFLRLYHVVRVLRDWTLIRFKNAMFLSKLVHVEQDTAYALKVLLHENPVAFVIGGLLSTLILFGYLLRTYDTTARPLKEGFGLSQAYWISLLSLTTVGYGDDVPKSHLGRIMVVLLVYIGSILIPLQIAIVERLLQFNMQEERMIRVYRLEQKRHSFQKAAVSLVVAWYRSLKTKKTENIGGYIQTWKKFRMSHASSMAHIPTGEHNKADNNLSTIAGSLITSVNDLAISVSRQATESHDLSRRCNKNMQAMQSIADRLAMLLHDGDTAGSIAAKINGSQSHQTSKSNQQASQESPLHPAANASNLNQETRQQRFARTNQTADHFDNAESVQDKHSSLSSDHQPQRHAIDQENPTENFQPGQTSGSQIVQLAGPRKSSLESHSSLGHEIDTQAPQEQMSSQLQGLIHQRAQAQSSRFQQQPATETVSSALPRAGDYGYSSSRAVSQMPGDDHGQEYMQSAQRTPLQQQQIQPSSHHPTYHNQSPDLAFSRSAAAPGFVENHVSPEGFYPPPHSYSPEAIQFHRDRIYEQARPSLNSILRSSPGLIPTSDAVRMRPATYFSSKSPPVPLLTRPNSPGPKGFTPVRVKPFNPQGVISSLQGSASAGSSSAYAKFLLARSEYKPESTQHSP
jgi:voltage-gated potassium channel Kch